MYTLTSNPIRFKYTRIVTRDPADITEVSSSSATTIHIV